MFSYKWDIDTDIASASQPRLINDNKKFALRRFEGYKKTERGFSQYRLCANFKSTFHWTMFEIIYFTLYDKDNKSLNIYQNTY